MNRSVFFNEKTYISQNLLSELLICSFIMSNLTKLLMVAHLSWATWAICSWLLICLERPERFAHSHSFVLSVSSVWYPVCDVDSVMSSVWCWVCDIKCVISSVWSWVCDLECVISSVWSRVCDIQCVISSVWYPVCDFDCVMSSVWCGYSYI